MGFIKRYRANYRFQERIDAAPWNGPVNDYDILKEATIAFVVVAFVALALAIIFSSPDVPPVTIKSWANAQPVGFTQVAVTELEGTSTSATYGPPFNNGQGSVQNLGGVSIQEAFGVRYSLDPAYTFIINPLKSSESTNKKLQNAIATYTNASYAQRMQWDSAYYGALQPLNLSSSKLPKAHRDEGPVPIMLSSLLSLARSGGLDTALLSNSSFYTTDYTNPLMFIGDSATSQGDQSYWGKIVSNQHLNGSQWGVMNETGSWPGQPWLWLYTLWYQIPPMSNSSNGDVEVVAIMTVLTFGLIFLPFIPVLRDIPRKVPIYRLIWRNYYKSQKQKN